MRPIASNLDRGSGGVDPRGVEGLRRDRTGGSEEAQWKGRPSREEKTLRALVVALHLQDLLLSHVDPASGRQQLHVVEVVEEDLTVEGRGGRRGRGVEGERGVAETQMVRRDRGGGGGGGGGEGSGRLGGGEGDGGVAGLTCDGAGGGGGGGEGEEGGVAVGPLEAAAVCVEGSGDGEGGGEGHEERGEGGGSRQRWTPRESGEGG